MTLTTFALVALGIALGRAVPTRPAIPPGANPQECNMHRIKSLLWSGGRKRKMATAVTGVMLVAASSAFAAWIVLSGTSGSGGATVSTSTIQDALKLTAKYDSSTVEPGSAQGGTVKADVENVATSPVRLLTLTKGIITSDKPACDTSVGLSFTPDSSSVGASSAMYAVGTTANVTLGTIKATTALDPDCAGAKLSIAFTGTTQP